MVEGEQLEFAFMQYEGRQKRPSEEELERERRIRGAAWINYNSFSARSIREGAERNHYLSALFRSRGGR